jgi:glutaredoxin 2
MQFCKMPQGFKKNPAVFQRAITLMLKKSRCKKFYLYRWFSHFWKTKEEFDYLAEILSTVNCYGLKENVDKRVKCQETVSFLCTKYKRIKYHQTLPSARNYWIRETKTKKTLQRFIEIINYDRMFVKNITKILSLLYNLLQKEKNLSGKKFTMLLLRMLIRNWRVIRVEKSNHWGVIVET